MGAHRLGFWECLRRCDEFDFLGCLLLLERESSDEGEVEAVHEEPQLSDSSCCCFCFCSFLVGRRLRREFFLEVVVLASVVAVVGALLVFRLSD